MIYLWRVSDNYPQSLIGEYQREGTPDRFLFKKGETLPEPVGLPIIKFNAPISKLRKFDCLTHSALVPLVSATCAELLREIAPSDVQLIKARVVGSDSVTDEFSLVNVTSKVCGIDRERSEFKCVPGTQQIMSFRKLSYVEDCLGRHGLARDSEYLAHLLVSNAVAERLINEGLSGIALIKPTEVAW